jgi:hypothetical protein
MTAAQHALPGSGRHGRGEFTVGMCLPRLRGASGVGQPEYSLGMTRGPTAPCRRDAPDENGKRMKR